jgi:hypothetical protein
MTDMLQTTFNGEELTHRVLWRVVLEQAEETDKRLKQERNEKWIYPSIVSRVFAYNTVEAYLNYVGERIAPEIWVDEWNYFRNEPYRGAFGKLRKIMDLVGLPWTPADRPLKTVLELKEIRDLIAHGKPEKLQGTVIHARGTLAPYPASTLRTMAASRDLRLVILPDVESFLDDIQRRAKPLLKVEDVWFNDYALFGPSSHGMHSTTLKR